LRITNTAHFLFPVNYWNGVKRRRGSPLPIAGGLPTHLITDVAVSNQHARPQHHRRALLPSLEVDGAFHLPVVDAGSPAPPLLRKFLSFSRILLDFAFQVASIQAWGATRLTISHIVSSNNYQTLVLSCIGSDN
jgi:hypothetical protein